MRYFPLLFLLLAVTTLAQEQIHSTHSNSASITSLIRDDRGVLWVATSEGLTAFANDHHYQFTPDMTDPNSIMDTEITGLSLTSTGSIVALSSSGLSFFDERSSYFKQLPLASRPISFQYDKQTENYWVPTENSGIALLSSSGDLIRIFQDDPLDPNSISTSRFLTHLKNQIFDFSNENFVFIATPTGFNVYNRTTKTFKRFFPKKGSSLLSELCTSIAPINERYLLVGTAKGVNIFDSKNQEFTEHTFLKDEYVNQLIYIGNGEFFINSNGNIKKLITRPNSNIYSIKKEFDYAADQKLLTEENKLPENNFLNVLHSSQRGNNLFATTMNGELFIYDIDNEISKRFTFPSHVVDVVANNDQYTVATLTSGLYRIEAGKNEVLSTRDDRWPIGMNSTHSVYWKASPATIVIRDNAVDDEHNIPVEGLLNQFSLMKFYLSNNVLTITHNNFISAINLNTKRFLLKKFKIEEDPTFKAENLVVEAEKIFISTGNGILRFAYPPLDSENFAEQLNQSKTYFEYNALFNNEVPRSFYDIALVNGKYWITSSEFGLSVHHEDLSRQIRSFAYVRGDNKTLASDSAHEIIFQESSTQQFNSFLLKLDDRDTSVVIKDVQIDTEDLETAPGNLSDDNRAITSQEYAAFTSTFGGTEIDPPNNLFSFPENAELWGGFANHNKKLYPLTLQEGGEISFIGREVSGSENARIKFVLEAGPMQNDPSVATRSIAIVGKKEKLYKLKIPPQPEKPAQLFIATRGQGIFVYNFETQKFKSITVDDGLLSNNISDIFLQDNGNLWAKSSSGVNLIVGDWTVSLTAADGLEMAPYSAQDSLFQHDNKITMFGDLVTQTFNAEKMITNFKEASLYVSQVTGTNAENTTNALRLSNENEISIDNSITSITLDVFSNINQKSELMRISYRLGKDSDWISNGKSKVIKINSIPWYTTELTIGGIDAVGQFIREPLTLLINRSPPWWGRYEMLFLYITLTILLIFGLEKYRTKKQKERLDNARKSEELKEARIMQQQMLPKRVPNSQELEISTFIQPATEVGGDYYDFYQTSEGLFAVCGDATGHGVSASIMVSITKAGLSGLQLTNPDQALYQLNNIVKQVNTGRSRMSLTIAKIMSDKILLSSAAMPPTYFYDHSKDQTREILIPNLPLGGLRKEKYEGISLAYNKGDVLVMISDGLPELPNANSEILDYQSILTCVDNHSSLSANQIKDSLVALSFGWSKGLANPDDITIVVIKKLT